MTITSIFIPIQWIGRDSKLFCPHWQNDLLFVSLWVSHPLLRNVRSYDHWEPGLVGGLLSSIVILYGISKCYIMSYLIWINIGTQARPTMNILCCKDRGLYNVFTWKYLSCVMLLADYLNYLLSDEINIPQHKHYDFYKLYEKT